MRSTAFLTFTLVLLALIAIVAGHGYMTNPVARTGDEDNVKTACSAAPTVPTGNYTVGENITVGWYISADHGGNVKWFISYDGNPANLVEIGSTTPIGRIGVFTSYIELDEFHTCTQCLLEWVWQTSGEPTPYLGCATITISAIPGVPIEEPVASTPTPEVASTPTPESWASSPLDHVSALLAFLGLAAFLAL